MGDAAGLAHLAIHRQGNRRLLDARHVLRAMDQTDGRGIIECLAHFPRTARIFHLPLQIAARHVETDRVAVDMLARLFHRDITATLADRHHQLAFIVVIAGLRRVRQFRHGARLRRHDGRVVAGFAKEEWRFAVRIGTHFTRMARVIAAHAIHAAYRELRIGAGDRQADQVTNREDIAGTHIAP
jgi:hypothetical protein